MQSKCEKSGAIYVEFPLPLPITGPQDILKCIATVIQQYGNKIKFALFDVITSPTAIVMPYHEITALCHQHDILVMLDGAHAIGQLQLDFRTMKCDYFVGNCHKW